MYLYTVCAGVVLGIAYAIVLPTPLFFLLFLTIPALLFFCFGVLKEQSSIILMGLFIFFFALGGIRTLPALVAPTTLDARIGAETTIEGPIVAEVDTRETHIRLVVLYEGVRVLVTTERFVPVSFGDIIQAEGILEIPKPFEADGGRTFNYDRFLAKEGIYYTLPFAEVSILEEGTPSFRGVLFSIKQFFIQGIGLSIPEPQAALGGGITVGARRSLGEDLLEAFQITGLIHIVVLSGYNVTIIAEAIMRSLSFLPRRVGLGIGIGAIISFVLMVGAGATIVRAGIMAVIALIARATGKTYALTRALIVAGLLMLIANPLILMYDPSFQLSFIATLGLIHIAPRIETLIPWVSSRFELRSIVGATIGTQIAVLPLLLYQTGLLSFSAFPANLLVLPVIPFAMLFTLIAGLVGTLPGIGVILSIPAHLSLSYVLFIAESIAALPGAAITIPAFPFIVVVLAYGLLIFFLYRTRKNIPELHS